jgi:hypothetical protein
MPVFDVTIQATVTKTIRVSDVDDEKAAIEAAHQIFTVEPNQLEEEKYDEQCLGCKEVK